MSLALAIALQIMIPPGRSAADSLVAQRYQGCPGASDLTHLMGGNEIAPRSRLDAHVKLRNTWNAAMPTGTPRILLFSEGGHMISAGISLVAVRSPEGFWHVSRVGQSQVWLENAQPMQMPPYERDLGPAESGQLDQLLSDACLRASPSGLTDPEMILGGLSSVLEVEDAAGTWRISWMGRSTQQVQALVRLLTSG